MANTSSRTLRLLSLLQTHRYWTGDELADRLDVSVRTLRRDVDRLRELGYPVEAGRGVGGGYQLAPGASLPPLVLDDEEAVALAVGLHTAAQGSLTGIAEASVRALAKVIQVMPRGLRRRVEALRSATAAPVWGAPPNTDPEALVLLAQACRDDERVTFGYQAADGRESERRIEPAQLVQFGRRWYLVGYDLDRGAWRSFRLDRMQRPELTGKRFAPRPLPGGNAAAFVEAGRRRSGQHRVQLDLAADAAAVRAQIGPWSEVSELDAGHCRVKITADSLQWAAFAVGVTGAEITACDSPELIALLRDWSERFARAGAALS
ncbi:helix-turn-helix transcriptional regulator [Microlunatus speluncae]|uniref:helix-turn-helix transcriptional regulator n=1 Tax=Microlunatus speluncae TaxID=2594267 RepID=UPI0012662F0E|nr:transcriptional regulator [Microlunatus speluncae]